MSNSDSDFSSALSTWRDRTADLTDHVSSLRWRIGGAVLVALIAAGLWGLASTGKHAASADTYTDHSYSTTTIDPPATTDSVAQAVVYATGAVKTPGLYTVATNARISDVITAAGGLTADADPDRVNLAAKVADGQRIYIARKGEAVPDDGTASADPSGATAGPVNINEASAQELDTLSGVGPSTAAAIVQYRSAHGPFKSVNDLANVKGIGPAKLAQLKDHITV